jgi:hypothetical protein
MFNSLTQTSSGHHIKQQTILLYIQYRGEYIYFFFTKGEYIQYHGKYIIIIVIHGDFIQTIIECNI